MSLLYDGPGALSLLGGVLNNYTGPFLTQIADWDHPNDRNLRTTDLIVHNGELYVAWVEGDSSHLAHGPYVSRWDGAAWQPCGGDIGVTVDGLTLTNWNPSLQADGTKYVPNYPTLASDGTTLYLGYTYRVASIAPVSGHWAPRRLVVNAWDGATWSSFGQILPDTNNSAVANPGTGTIQPPYLCASPAEPGVCYASFQEIGFITGAPGSSSPWTARTVVSRFDGSSLTGTEHTVDSISGTGPTLGLGIPATAPVSIGNDSGAAFIFWSYTTALVSPIDVQMIDWATLTIVQTIPGGAGPISHAVRAGVGRYYMRLSSLIYQILDDGTGPFELYLGDVAAATPPSTSSPARFPQAYLMPDGATNLWYFLGTDTGPDGDAIDWWHQNCPGWSRESYPRTLTEGWLLTPATHASARLFADSIDVGMNNLFGRVVVHHIPILRDSRSCGGLHIWDRFGVDA